MPRNTVKLDHDGIAEMLKSAPVRTRISSLANEVSANVTSSDSVVRNGLPVRVDHQTTDRSRSLVIIAHAAGLAVQAKHGVLTQAASAAGLEVTER